MKPSRAASAIARISRWYAVAAHRSRRAPGRADDKQTDLPSPMMLTDSRPPGPAFRRSAAGLMLGALILISGCASPSATSPASQPPSAAGSPSASGPASPAASATPPPASIRRLAADYLAIARPANHRLDVEVDGFKDHSRDDLAEAAANLRAEAATELHFDRQLSRIPFPAAIAAIARALVRANQSRIALTRREARSASLARLRSFASTHKAADAAVEVQARAIRKALSLPPPSTS